MEQLNLTGIFFLLGVIFIAIAAFLIHLVVGLVVVGISFFVLSYLNYQADAPLQKDERSF